MGKEYKLVVVTPAGRKRYMEVLFPYILRSRDFIDEYRIWVNTGNQEDLDYFHHLKREYPDFVTLDESAKDAHGYGTSDAIHHFFKNTVDQNTIYIRLDDDIVWLDNNFFQKMYSCRINNPQPFLIFGNIVNNAICDHLHQRNGVYEGGPEYGYDCLDNNGWRNADLAEEKHRIFIENFNKRDLKSYRFKNWTENEYKRISINAICWFGKDMQKINGEVDLNEEEFLSMHQPEREKRPCLINGDALCAHFAFHTQREHMDQTDILGIYKKMSEELDTIEEHYENVDVVELVKNLKNPIVIIVNGTVKIINSGQ